VDSLGAKLPGNDEETVLQPAPLRDHEPWQQVTQHSAASPGGLGEIAESGRGPVVAVCPCARDSSTGSTQNSTFSPAAGSRFMGRLPPGSQLP
jgi:hypothetical protein